MDGQRSDVDACWDALWWAADDRALWSTDEVNVKSLDGTCGAAYREASRVAPRGLELLRMLGRFCLACFLLSVLDTGRLEHSRFEGWVTERERLADVPAYGWSRVLYSDLETMRSESLYAAVVVVLVYETAWAAIATSLELRRLFVRLDRREVSRLQSKIEYLEADRLGDGTPSTELVAAAVRRGGAGLDAAVATLAERARTSPDRKKPGVVRDLARYRPGFGIKKACYGLLELVLFVCALGLAAYYFPLLLSPSFARGLHGDSQGVTAVRLLATGAGTLCALVLARRTTAALVLWTEGYLTDEPEGAEWCGGIRQRPAIYLLRCLEPGLCVLVAWLCVLVEGDPDLSTAEVSTDASLVGSSGLPMRTERWRDPPRTLLMLALMLLLPLALALRVGLYLLVSRRCPVPVSPWLHAQYAANTLLLYTTAMALLAELRGAVSTVPTECDPELTTPARAFFLEHLAVNSSTADLGYVGPVGGPGYLAMSAAAQREYVALLATCVARGAATASPGECIPTARAVFLGTALAVFFSGLMNATSECFELVRTFSLGTASVDSGPCTCARGDPRHLELFRGPEALDLSPPKTEAEITPLQTP